MCVCRKISKFYSEWKTIPEIFCSHQIKIRHRFLYMYKWEHNMLNQGLEDYLTVAFYFKSVIVFFWVYMHFDMVNVMELEVCTSVFMVQSVWLIIRVLSLDRPTGTSIIWHPNRIMIQWRACETPLGKRDFLTWSIWHIVI